MLFRSLDENNDWNFGKGQNDYVRDNEAVRLNTRTRILSWLNDCFFAQNEGIDWVNRLGQKNQRELLEQDLRNTILQTEGVTEIIRFSTDLVGREFFAEYEANTIYTVSFNDRVTRSI